MALVQSLITVFIFLFMLGALVIIHELGHFVTARLAGVRVLEFGVGFPPRAKVLRSEGETMYTLNWLPIGGFVRLEGEDGDSEDPRSFTRAPLLTKMLILIAGVAMNLLLAFAIFTAISWLPGNAWGISFQSVQPDSPAATVGLVAGDTIVAINGTHYDQFNGPQPMVDELRANAGQTVTLGVVSAAGDQRDLTVTMRDPSQIDAEHGALGIFNLTFAPSSATFTRSPVDAIEMGAQRTADAFRLIATGLGSIAGSITSHPTEAPPASGPVGIAVMVGDVFWQSGLVATLYLAGILSANLALVNILPFPPLDGGRMLMLLIKSVAGSRVSIQAERLTYLVGFGFLFAFLIWITYFDIARIGGVVQ